MKHPQISVEEYNNAKSKLIEDVGKINLRDEYEKIKNKSSNLSKHQRDVVVALVELADEFPNFFEL